jgi:hypothetical protein
MQLVRLFHRLLTLCCVCFLLSTTTASAWWSQGKVFCDSNTNRIIDPSDPPIQSVLVIVTNVSGTYSNASWTAADGFFIVPLLATPDQYVEYIHPATIPADATPIIPSSGMWMFGTTSNLDKVTADFLIGSAHCPPVLPMRTNACWLTGGGTLSNGKGTPADTFGGVVYPGCNPDAGNGGNWNHVAHALKLHFQGKVIDAVNCGNVPGIPPGSTSPKTPVNFIEFQGAGTLKGIGGNKANYGEVLFFARAEDRGEPGKNLDRYYLRVYDSAGTTLMLVSGDSSDPDNVVPAIISGGNLQLHVSSCDTPAK